MKIFSICPFFLPVFLCFSFALSLSFYSAPEVLSRDNAYYASDIYSFGVTVSYVLAMFYNFEEKWKDCIENNDSRSILDFLLKNLHTHGCPLELIDFVRRTTDPVCNLFAFILYLLLIDYV